MINPIQTMPFKHDNKTIIKLNNFKTSLAKLDDTIQYHVYLPELTTIKADCYLPRYRLVVQIGTGNLLKEALERLDNILRTKGYTVCRYSTNSVISSPFGVIKNIENSCKTLDRCVMMPVTDS